MTNGKDAIGNSEQGPQDGLTKREYFAAMAMQGLCVEGSWSREIIRQSESIGSTATHAISIYAVDLADALIEQLNKPTP